MVIPYQSPSKALMELLDYTTHAKDAQQYIQQMQNPQSQEVYNVYNEYASIPKKYIDKLQSHLPLTTTPELPMNKLVLHPVLRDKLLETMREMKDDMLARFKIVMPYVEVQEMLITPEVCDALQAAGKHMAKQHTRYNYRLGETVTIVFNCRGSEEMPMILFPSEVTNYSEEFLDLIRPTYLLIKTWTDVELAFKAVLNIIHDTRELNFFVPWLKYVIPSEEHDFMNKYNGRYQVSSWCGGNLKHQVADLICNQIKTILTHEHTRKRTWMPVELVQMVRQGDELVTQFNIMKGQKRSDYLLSYKGTVTINIEIDIQKHPTIKWVSEAVAHDRMNEALRLKEVDDARSRGR